MALLPTPANDVAHIIQLAVAPVFLLSAVGITLTLFSNRLARIVDRARKLEERMEADPDNPHLLANLAVLQQRARYINRAMTLGTVSGLLVALTVVLLFAGELFGRGLTLLIAVVFSGAMLALTAALLLFLIEVRYATSKLWIGPRLRE